MTTAHDRFILALFLWSTCILLDWGMHYIGVHPGEWNWKRSVVIFGVGTAIATMLLGPLGGK